MKKIATLTAAALVIGACGPAKEDPAQKYRDALPKSEAVQVGEPTADTAAGALSVRSSAVLGDDPAHQSEWAIASRNFALMINGGTKLTLELIRFITFFPPTSCDDSTCTWGPGVGEDGLNRFKLDVTHDGDHYDYALQGQPGLDGTADWIPIISGYAYPGADADHGHGRLVLDFDADEQLVHGPGWADSPGAKDHGNVTIDYDNTVSPVTVTALFVGAQNEKQETVNVAYSFEKSASGGNLQIGVENVTTTEIVKLHTRWSPSGAGRADVNYDGPDGVGGRVTFTASECWDGEVNNFAEVYDSKPEPDFGTENACSPFSSAEWATIELP